MVKCFLMEEEEKNSFVWVRIPISKKIRFRIFHFSKYNKRRKISSKISRFPVLKHVKVLLCSLKNANLAGEEGFEPSQTESESVVLPLHNSPIN